MKRAALIVTAASTLMVTSVFAQDQSAQIAQGQQLFQYWCAACHGPGLGNPQQYLPGEAALRAKYKGALPGLLPERTDLTPAFVKVIVRSGISIMPFFRKTEINDQQLDAIAAYLSRNNSALK
jgi:(+)-pinoresinol hydroxylase